jgi:hypothetical protein
MEFENFFYVSLGLLYYLLLFFVRLALVLEWSFLCV